MYFYLQRTYTNKTSLKQILMNKYKVMMLQGYPVFSFKIPFPAKMTVQCSGTARLQTLDASTVERALRS